MAVKTYRPQLAVTLKKNISRTTAGGNIAASQRFQGAARNVDLTPYLGKGGIVATQRSTRAPAGMWTVTLTDQMVVDQYESFYGLFEANDLIELRFARDISLYPDGVPPVVMRGFLTSIRRRRVMTDNGPQRAVVLSGQDYGKVLQMMRITYLPGMVLGQDLLTAYKLFLNYGVQAQADVDAANFISSIMSQVVNPFLAQMRASASGGAADPNSPVLDMGLDATEGSGVVSPFGSQDWPGGSVYDLMRYFGDVGAFNELYVEDRATGPYLVYRPTPFRDLTGAYIQNVQTPPPTVKLTDEDVIAEDVGRSDANVANYYWVDAPRYNLIDPTSLQAAAAGGQLQPSPLLTGYPNSDPNLYGVRVLKVGSEQGPRIDGLGEADYTQGQGIGIGLINTKRGILIKNNQDNIVLEDGLYTLKGNETVTAGCYLDIQHGVNGAAAASGGGLPGSYYAHTVAHEVRVMGSFVTNVTFDRGTGFVERIQRGSGAAAPYLAEWFAKGPYG